MAEIYKSKYTGKEIDTALEKANNSENLYLLKEYSKKKIME